MSSRRILRVAAIALAVLGFASLTQVNGAGANESRGLSQAARILADGRVTEPEYEASAHEVVECIRQADVQADGPTRPGRRQWEYEFGGSPRPGETDAAFQARITRVNRVCAVSFDKVSETYLRTHRLSDAYIRASALRLIDCLRSHGFEVPDETSPQWAAAQGIRQAMMPWRETGDTTNLLIVASCEDQEPDAFAA